MQKEREMENMEIIARMKEIFSLKETYNACSRYIREHPELESVLNMLIMEARSIEMRSRTIEDIEGLTRVHDDFKECILKVERLVNDHKYTQAMKGLDE
jgi:hypothetical protein